MNLFSLIFKLNLLFPITALTHTCCNNDVDYAVPKVKETNAAVFGYNDWKLTLITKLLIGPM